MSSRSKKIVEMAVKAAACEPDLDASCQPPTNQEEELDPTSVEDEIAFSSGSSDLYEPSSGDDDSSNEVNSILTDNDFDHEEVIGSYSTAHVEASTENNNNEEGVQIPDLPCEQTANQGKKKKLKMFPSIEKASKKRKRNPDEWKRRKATLARMRGESYISQRGNVIPAKQVNYEHLCKKICRLKCDEQFEINAREELFAQFHKLDTNAQNAFIFQSLLLFDVQRFRKGAKKHRAASIKYMMTLNGRSVQVCKTAFCSLLQVGRKKVDCIVQKKKQNNSAPPLDQRGRHDNRPHKIHEDVKQYIRQHIESFPAESSHYSRHINPHKKYLSPLLNLTKMFRLYLEKCNGENMPGRYTTIKQCSYVNIFETEYNLSFGQPKSDTCSTCDANQQTEEHHENVSLGFELQRKDRANARDNNNTCFVTMDLQQTMPLPKLTTNKAFYLRQMWFYNLGFHIISGSQKEFAVFCTWTEDVANRGSDEICSSLLTLLEMVDSLKEKDHLIIWSDSCSGQNKNWQLICLYQLLIKKNVFKTIDHKYPEVGHTYLDSDRDFGRIEKNLRKHENIFTPEKYREIISTASRNNVVLNMTNHFRDFTCIDSEQRLINRKKDLVGSKVPFRDLRWIRVEEFGSYLFKQSFLEYEPFRKVNILRNEATPSCEAGTSRSISTVKRLEKNAGILSDEKINDIKQQLLFVPEECKWFYEKVIKTNDEKVREGKTKKNNRRSM